MPLDHHARVLERLEFLGLRVGVGSDGGAAFTCGPDLIRLFVPVAGATRPAEAPPLLGSTGVATGNLGLRPSI
jgi:hypothetical protein